MYSISPERKIALVNREIYSIILNIRPLNFLFGVGGFHGLYDKDLRHSGIYNIHVHVHDIPLLHVHVHDIPLLHVHDMKYLYYMYMTYLYYMYMTTFITCTCT